MNSLRTAGTKEEDAWEAVFGASKTDQTARTSGTGAAATTSEAANSLAELARGVGLWSFHLRKGAAGLEHSNWAPVGPWLWGPDASCNRSFAVRRPKHSNMTKAVVFWALREG